MQGNTDITAKIYFHSVDFAILKLDVDASSSIRIRECYTNSECDIYSCSCTSTGAEGQVFADHEPMSIAMSPGTNTLLVGYPEYVLNAPSTEPSEAPTVSNCK